MDLWEDDDLDDGYVLVKQEDVVDGITSFMAAYLLSLKKTKVDIPFTWCCMGSFCLLVWVVINAEFHVVQDLSPDQLQKG